MKAVLRVKEKILKQPRLPRDLSLAFGMAVVLPQLMAQPLMIAVAVQKKQVPRKTLEPPIVQRLWGKARLIQGKI
jgi:hypothetical protein